MDNLKSKAVKRKERLTSLIGKRLKSFSIKAKNLTKRAATTALIASMMALSASGAMSGDLKNETWSFVQADQTGSSKINNKNTITRLAQGHNVYDILKTENGKLVPFANLNSKPIQVVFDESSLGYSDFEEVVQNCVKMLNNVFAVINPEYKFKMVKFSDFNQNNQNYILILGSLNLGKKNEAGLALTTYGVPLDETFENSMRTKAYIQINMIATVGFTSTEKEAMITHELLGHVFGLTHSTNPNSIMTAYAGPAFCASAIPSADALYALKSIYYVAGSNKLSSTDVDEFIEQMNNQRNAEIQYYQSLCELEKTDSDGARRAALKMFATKAVEIYSQYFQNKFNSNIIDARNAVNKTYEFDDGKTTASKIKFNRKTVSDRRSGA